MSILYYIIEFIGISLLWIAVDLGREPKIKPFKKEWWEIMLLLVIAHVIFKENTI